MNIEDALSWLKEHREELLQINRDGSYNPSPVRRKEIPKPGGGVRKLVSASRDPVLDNRKGPANEPPHIVRTVQKRGLQGGRTSESKTGLAKRERSQASLCLEALVVIEVDVLVD